MNLLYRVWCIIFRWQRETWESSVFQNISINNSAPIAINRIAAIESIPTFEFRDSKHDSESNLDCEMTRWPRAWELL